MRPTIGRSAQALLDVLVIVAAYGFAYLLRFEGDPPLHMRERLLLTTPVVVLVQYGLFVAFGVHRFAWRYVGLPEVVRILQSVVAAGAVLIGARTLAVLVAKDYPGAAVAIVPLGVSLIHVALAFIGITGIRVARRMLAERQERLRRHAREAIPTMLVGAGRAGVIVARELSSRPDLGMKAVGFLDDDRSKVGTEIQGIPVLGTTAELERVCGERGARQVLVAIASLPGREVRRLRASCEAAGVTMKVIPGLYEIVGGAVELSRIREVSIDDLLRREPVQLEEALVGESLRGRVVLVSGAGGSIGSELCRQICRFEPRRLVLVERFENALFVIDQELRRRFPQVEITPCLADVSDAHRIDTVLTGQGIEVVFHAAAHKHVPMMESNPGEAVKNNVHGTRVLADAAARANVRTFVMISTDKAVNPSSVMGATKRLAELYVQARSQAGGTIFVSVRFGNVLGSAGSVVPIFQEQIARGGPVTVTHPDMRRYFMTIPEACQLVLQAGAMGKGGEVFVLDMGEPVKIVDLARDVIELSGLRPGEDIEIAFSGVRPGEKLFEELSTAEEAADRTRHPKIFVGRVRGLPLAEIGGAIDGLLARADGTPDEIRTALREVLPEFIPPAPTPAEPKGSP